MLINILAFGANFLAELDTGLFPLTLVKRVSALYGELHLTGAAMLSRGSYRTLLSW